MPSLLNSISSVSEEVIPSDKNQSLSSSIDSVSSQVIGDGPVQEESQDQEEKKKKKPQESSKDTSDENQKGEEGQEQSLWSRFKNWVKSFWPEKDDYKGDPSKVSSSSENVSGKEEEQEQNQQAVVEKAKAQAPENKETKVEKNSVKAPKENQAPELTEEEKEVAAVVKLLKGIKDKAQGDSEKEKEMLNKASKLVADTKDPELIKGWNEVLGKAAKQNPDLKEMANNLSGQINAKNQVKELVNDLGQSSSVNPENVDREVAPTLERLAADHNKSSPGAER
jgi:hypothetical protein